MADEFVLCNCPRCLNKNPLGVFLTKKAALNHKRSFLWAQQLEEEQIDNEYINFNSKHLKKKTKGSNIFKLYHI